MNKRKINKIPGQVVVCNICKKQYTDVTNISGALTRHLRTLHNIQIINSNQFNNYFTHQQSDYCKICGYNFKHYKSINNHLIQKHQQCTVIQYCNKYPQDKQYFENVYKNIARNKLLKTAVGKVKCLQCNKYFVKLTNTHMKIKHNMTISQYKIKHNTNIIFSEYASNKASEITTDMNLRLNKFGQFTSSYQLVFKQYLQINNIKYQYHYVIFGRQFDFYLPDYYLLIQIDGKAFHTDMMQDLTFLTFLPKINDFNKNNIAKQCKLQLLRLRYDKTQIKDINDIYKYQYFPNYQIQFNTIIMSKQYLIKFKQKKGTIQLLKRLKLFLRFIRTFQPEFPYPTTTQTIEQVIKNLQTYSYANVQKDNKIYHNACNSAGSNYLKSIFKNYYKSSYKKNKSPVQA